MEHIAVRGPAYPRVVFTAGILYGGVPLLGRALVGQEYSVAATVCLFCTPAYFASLYHTEIGRGARQLGRTALSRLWSPGGRRRTRDAELKPGRLVIPNGGHRLMHRRRDFLGQNVGEFVPPGVRGRRPHKRNCCVDANPESSGSFPTLASFLRMC